MDTSVYRPIEEVLKLAIIDLQVQMVKGTFRPRGPRHARSFRIRLWRRRR